MTQEEFFSRYTYDTEDDHIGGGSFGDVYKAFDEVEDRWVAIKVSKRIILNGKTFSLQDEFETTQKLAPNVNIAKYESLYTYKTPQGVFDYAIMQFYPDGNLKNLLKANVLSATEKEDLALQLLQGIGFLHQNKIIHRDLKPANILLSKRTEKNGAVKNILKIADFGLSKVAKPNEASRMSNSFGGGTIEYSSPEQLMAKTLRYNTDLWAFGVIAYEVLTGKSLFSQANVGSSAVSEHEVIQNILKKDIAQDLLLLPKKWQKSIASCLVKDPELRVKSSDEILEIFNELVIKSKETLILKNENKESCENLKNYNSTKVIQQTFDVKDSVFILKNKENSKIKIIEKDTLNLENIGKYIGRTVNGLRDGIGICYFLDGTIYEGSWKNDDFEGKGSFYCSDGKYVGDYKKGHCEGKGTNFYTNGDTYEGDWKYNMANGKGTYNYCLGGKYEGDWKDGVKEGRGTEYYKSGGKYVGDFKNGVREGKGTYYYKNGDKYVGDFKNDVKEGKGTYYWKDGRKYVGDFKNGVSEGYGKEYDSNGNLTKSGRWKNDEFIGK